MNILQIGVIICLVCIGFYTLFLFMKTMIELGDYMEKHEETDTKKSYTQKALEAVVAFSILFAISFCPVLNTILCAFLFYVENNRDAMFEKFEEMYCISKDFLE